MACAVSPALHFVLDPRATHWPDLERLDERDIAVIPERFVGGRNSWIAQTFVRLRPALEAHGWQVTTGARFLPGAINMAHRDDANRFSREAASSFLVVVRADRAPVHACDIAIAQNALDLRGNERHVPLWPQPGLVRRDPRRGARVECIAYQGRVERLPRWFTDPEFLHALRRRAVRFEVRSRGWHDYSTVDAVIATREESARVLTTKPATKLYNGWLAGVPVLAAPEPAYRELRQGPLDLLEVDGPFDVLRAVDALQGDARLYGDMVRNGQERAVAFSVEATRARWLQLLEHEIAARFMRSQDRREGRPVRFVAGLARQRLASRWHKGIVALQRSARPERAAGRDCLGESPGFGEVLPVK